MARLYTAQYVEDCEVKEGDLEWVVSGMDKVAINRACCPQLGGIPVKRLLSAGPPS